MRTRLRQLSHDADARRLQTRHLCFVRGRRYRPSVDTLQPGLEYLADVDAVLVHLAPRRIDGVLEKDASVQEVHGELPSGGSAYLQVFRDQVTGVLRLVVLGQASQRVPRPRSRRLSPSGSRSWRRTTSQVATSCPSSPMRSGSGRASSGSRLVPPA
jgi:hypothetical protein